MWREALERVQKRFSRMLPGMEGISYEGGASERAFGESCIVVTVTTEVERWVT